jgi:hypothetical protein
VRPLIPFRIERFEEIIINRGEKMKKHIIVGVHIVDREAHAVKVQEIFTKNGSQIKTRLGLHDDICSSNGLILLEMEDSRDTINMVNELVVIDGIDCKTMMFSH